MSDDYLFWRSSCQEEATPLSEGAEIFNRFCLLQHLGDGGFGSVWRAEDRWLDNVVALKISHSSSDLSRETTVLRRLPKDRFVSIYDYVIDEETGISAYSMELLDAPWSTVDAFRDAYIVRNLKSPATAMKALRAIVSIGIDVLTTLGHLHGKKYGKEGRWCHGDIKPNNLYLHSGFMRKCMRTPWGETFAPFTKVGDLGLARKAGDLLLGGTRGFRAPEQNGSKVVSPNTDIYSVGQTLLCLIHGEPLSKYHVATEKRIKDILEEYIPCDYLAGHLGAVLNKMTSQDPTRRPRSTEAITQLQQIVESEDDWLILSAFANVHPAGLKRSDAAEMLFPAFGRRYKWANRTDDRIAKIAKKITLCYQRGLLKRPGNGHYYFLKG